MSRPLDRAELIEITGRSYRLRNRDEASPAKRTKKGKTAKSSKHSVAEKPEDVETSAS